MATIGDLMRTTRFVQWGLRGDPVLWERMRDALMQTPLPPSADALRQILHATFQGITGHPLARSDAPLPVESLLKDNGGMSNGLVSPMFWIDTAFPTIEQRYTEERSKT
ncbi:hypothetical protein RXV86_08625 [Alisedimentitalea sp. MJ-SS2]|uniref:hypothetical protein n=1 Tax=Aliisedimentitalea sp. MJ-SS2 TaxID=3049795 RepID=UPI00290FFF1D|nr:hypothetical protein [Alisedimentitalea sp. MJ-SS2]MDU8927445.1 hypothetical protein [Alisedimentitalea sp. MJ-SS2]